MKYGGAIIIISEDATFDCHADYTLALKVIK